MKEDEDWGELEEEELEELVDEVLIDANDMSEACTAFCDQIQDEVKFPFETMVLGQTVKVLGVDLRESYGMIFECQASGGIQAIDVLDLPMPDRPPKGAKWIYAYRYWACQL